MEVEKRKNEFYSIKFRSKETQLDGDQVSEMSFEEIPTEVKDEIDEELHSIYSELDQSMA